MHPSPVSEPSSGWPVRVEGLTRRYGSEFVEVEALRAVDLELEAGAAVALMGPSGSGKSTLLHLIGAMDRPSEGTIWVGGIEVGNLSGDAAASYRAGIGFVFQAFHLLGALSALENVLVSAIPRHTARALEESAKSLLERVGLGDRLTALPAQLSGGEQQRVAIARALLASPGLLLADEPTGNLDSETGGAIVELLLELRSERGMTLVLATHDPQIAQRMDRVVRLRDGRLVT